MRREVFGGGAAQVTEAGAAPQGTCESLQARIAGLRPVGQPRWAAAGGQPYRSGRRVDLGDSFPFLAALHPRKYL